ncbi:MAG: hypothetical protein DRR08_10130 [Candidatus Parabeggiatoa sp. nov. 2]|nr:MAG: hypothetical protein B6247_13530 [Beggiatoa sp. 4572_84]RKZ60915.1 MAG: hypothetical protein DRR08_10130 [Gammaproteobacteria bacterium]
MAIFFLSITFKIHLFALRTGAAWLAKAAGFCGILSQGPQYQSAYGMLRTGRRHRHYLFQKSWHFFRVKMLSRLG